MFDFVILMRTQKQTVENGTSTGRKCNECNSQFNSQLIARKQEAVKKLNEHARGTLTNNRDNAIRCKEALYQ